MKTSLLYKGMGMFAIYMSCDFIIRAGDTMNAGYWKYPIFFLLWMIGWHLFELGFWTSQREMINVLIQRKSLKKGEMKLQKVKGQWDK